MAYSVRNTRCFGVGPEVEEVRRVRSAAHAIVAGPVRATHHHRDLGNLRTGHRRN